MHSSTRHTHIHTLTNKQKHRGVQNMRKEERKIDKIKSNKNGKQISIYHEILSRTRKRKVNKKSLSKGRLCG